MTADEPTYMRIINDFRTRIASGELRPGVALPTRQQLRRTYGVSRQPVETAMLVLRTQGLVVGEPGRGCYVTADHTRIRAALGETANDDRQPL